MDRVWIHLPFTFKRGEIISLFQQSLSKRPRDDRTSFMETDLSNNIHPSQFWEYSGSCFFQAAERFPNTYEHGLCVFTQIEIEMQMDS